MINPAFVSSFQNLCLAAQAPEQSSPMLPLEIDAEEWMENYAYQSYLDNEGDWYVSGCPQPGMYEYTTECREIVR